MTTTDRNSSTRSARVEAYYPTRTESAIFDESLADIAQHIGPRAFVIEPGAGNGTKAVRLLNALEEPVAVAVVDISMAYAQGLGGHPRRAA
jgi:uncharacterized SAM-dependent methyltransferase